MIGLAIAACGGEAIIDGANDSEACGALASRAMLMCHGAVGVSPTGRVCSIRCTDDEGHALESVCEADSCRCFYDDELQCSCTQSVKHDSCEAIEPCCPSPWQ